MIVKDMTSEDCADVLSKGHIGHLACAKDDRPYIVPVQYAYDEPNIYSFSLPGQKIEWLRGNPKSCFQVAEMHEDGGWRSVVVEGLYEEYPDDEQWHAERLNAWSLLEKRANWWEPGALKPDAATESEKAGSPIFFAIRIRTLTGRQSIKEIG